MITEERLCLSWTSILCWHLPALVDWLFGPAVSPNQEILQAFTKTQDISLPADSLFRMIHVNPGLSRVEETHVLHNSSLPESSKYLVRRCLEPQKSRTSGDVWGFKHRSSQDIWKTMATLECARIDGVRIFQFLLMSLSGHIDSRQRSVLPDVF